MQGPFWSHLLSPAFNQPPIGRMMESNICFSIECVDPLTSSLQVLMHNMTSIRCLSFFVCHVRGSQIDWG